VADPAALRRFGLTVQELAGILLMLRGASGKDIVEGVKERLAIAKQSLSPDVEARPFYDRTNLVETALGTVQTALPQGAVLVLFMLLFLMGHLRSAMIVALQLPLVVLATFLLMDLAGMSSNLMTLSGLAIAIGMLGDGAIVLVENGVRLFGRRGKDTEADDRVVSSVRRHSRSFVPSASVWWSFPHGAPRPL
jgi:cobalt-zinc-cadmium resistance protein CzcA